MSEDENDRPRKSWLVPVPDQSERQRGGPGSIVDRQSADHRALDELMRAYDDEPDPDARGRIVAELGERALRHAFAEEVVLFPAYRKHFPDAGDELTAHIEGDHQQVNDLLHALQRADPRAPGYDAQVREAFAVIRHDAHDEEDDLLPRLQQVADDAELQAIGAAWEAARTASPTRPHPKVSRRPPWNALAALGLAASDRVKDAVDAVAPVGTGRRTVVVGLLAGALGAAAMTATEKAEQAVTGRTGSFMPAHTLQALLGRDVHDSTPVVWVMHYGQGAAVGVLRAVMAQRGLRGAAAWPVFTGVRLAVDQTLENGTGVGAPPWTWSRPDLVVDVVHKAVYALVTGLVADRSLPRR
ncbi:hemerythrin domain-containing protein [Streptomyces sp. NP160]|uniref:hemerythrin domain-containing protein n=1 Tax=Streptomyces sp. NP160 TaxID=2586637 RepID=UPI00111893F2|nr:hemerythrin domain-containing protein [Streptomyces sp. NP160]TNM69196.1 hemerythrin domain-containing protein [Streptomyces sp. NP160]